MTIQHLDTLDTCLARIEARHPTIIELGLERTQEVLARLQLVKPARCVITVGGTNGKGSTVAFIEAIARAAGLQVGAYTSPHISRYNERVRINGAMVDDAQLIDAFNVVEAAHGETSLTYFETGTLAALWLFAQANLDLAILEVGLGGRLDAVNVVDADVAVITTVALDHQDWLGDSVEAIGAEKVGIARAGRPLVLGDDDPPASVLRRAYAIGAPSWRIGCDFHCDVVDEAHWQYREPGFACVLPKPTLLAPVQVRNAAVAIAALRASALEIHETALREGVANTAVPGRLQCVQAGAREVWLDVAHNPQAAAALNTWLEQTPATPTHAVLAMLEDKDAAGVVQALQGHITHWHLAGLACARGQSAQQLRQRARVFADNVSEHADVATALNAALQAPEHARILVLGSFHTVAEALAVLEARASRL